MWTILDVDGVVRGGAQQQDQHTVHEASAIGVLRFLEAIFYYSYSCLTRIYSQARMILRNFRELCAVIVAEIDGVFKCKCNGLEKNGTGNLHHRSSADVSVKTWKIKSSSCLGQIANGLVSVRFLQKRAEQRKP